MFLLSTVYLASASAEYPYTRLGYDDREENIRSAFDALLDRLVRSETYGSAGDTARSSYDNINYGRKAWMDDTRESRGSDLAYRLERGEEDEEAEDRRTVQDWMQTITKQIFGGETDRETLDLPPLEGTFEELGDIITHTLQPYVTAIQQATGTTEEDKQRQMQEAMAKLQDELNTEEHTKLFADWIDLCVHGALSANHPTCVDMAKRLAELADSHADYVANPSSFSSLTSRSAYSQGREDRDAWDSDKYVRDAWDRYVRARDAFESERVARSSSVDRLARGEGYAPDSRGSWWN